MRAGAVAVVVLGACAVEPSHESDRPDSPFDRVVEIGLELDPDDWARLRAETRSWAQIYGSCLAGPFSSPYHFYPATVTVDGERLERVGVRKRGFLGSLSIDKPSLKLALDRHAASQTFAGADEMLLNNAVQDPSYLRQCLAYRVFADAGLPAPRCGFARVRVNGEDLGLYVHVEALDDAFVAGHFAHADGALYEGTFSDFRVGWTATFELDAGPAGDRAALDAVVAALERPDDELLAAVDQVVDVDRFVTFWAVEVLVGHRDGYAGNANNFSVYRDPADGRFDFIPWGTDTTFRAEPIRARSFLPRRLYGLPAGRDLQAQRLRELLASTWDENALLAELDRIEALIAPVAGEDGGWTAHVDEVRAFVGGRRAVVLAELDAGSSEVAPPLEPPCFDVIGSVATDLATRWGTLGGDAFAEGDATLAVVLEGAALDVAEAGALAGRDPAEPSRALLRVVGTLADATAVIVVLQLEAASLRPGVTLELDGADATGYAYRYTPGTGLTSAGLIPGGRVEIVDAATTDGAPVHVRFEGPLVRLPP